MRNPARLLAKSFSDPEIALLSLAAILANRGTRPLRPPELPTPSLSEIERVSRAFTAHGSDKTSQHSYERLYASVLKALPEAPRILEIGLGTNFTDVPRNMGETGVPGASLWAFKELRPDAEIHGADIDRRILFQSDGIATHWVDQRDLTSLLALRRALGGEGALDLVVDDGLHSKRSNLNTFRALLPSVRSGGFYVVEDLDASAIAFWRYVFSSMHVRGAVLDLRRERGWHINIAAIVAV